MVSPFTYSFRHGSDTDTTDYLTGLKKALLYWSALASKEMPIGQFIGARQDTFLLRKINGEAHKASTTKEVRPDLPFESGFVSS